MSKRKPGKSENSPFETTSPEPLPLYARLRLVLLACATALLVATPLITSEGAHLGGGVVLNMLWVLLLLGWSLWGLAQPKFPFRFGLVDASILIFFLLVAVSAIVMAPHGNARFAISTLWQWIAFGIAFFLIRQLAINTAECRALVLVMIGVAICLSMHGHYQYGYEHPRRWTEYQQLSEEEKEQKWNDVGIDGNPNSSSRRQAEDRLRSVEPIASFALANSLAGALAPWLIAVLGIALVLPSSILHYWRTNLVLGLIATLIVFCLILTKSRSVYLATAVGIILLWFYDWFHERKIGWKLPILGSLSLIALVGTAFAIGGLDIEVLSQAKLSFSYRLEYWSATLSMIGDYPWFGCGLGNFQQYYTAYKLPQASEEILDPHNFIFEIWSSAGSLSLLAFLSATGFFFRRLWKTAKIETNGLAESATTSSYRFIYWGAAVGALCILPIGLLVDRTPETIFSLPLPTVWIVGVPVAVVGFYLLDHWVEKGRLPWSLLPIAIAVLLINFLAAGGIGVSGVANTFWLLVALTLNLFGNQDESEKLPRTAGAVFALLAALLVIACLQTDYSPVLRGKAELFRGSRLKGDYQAADLAFANAAKVDVFSPRPWELRAGLVHSVSLPPYDDATFDEYTEQLLQRDRKSSKIRIQVGQWYLDRFQRGNDRKHLTKAIKFYREAVDLYPNSNIIRARLAWAHHIAGDNEKSTGQAAEALRLDDLNPHKEQKLSQRIVFDAQIMERDIEQLMRRLCKSTDKNGLENNRKK